MAQLRDEDFKPADPKLFDKTITTLSASLASQTNLSTGISEFVTSKRKESYLAHTSCPIGESVKRDLLVAPGTENLLFNQLLLEKVVSTIKEDSLISSTASLASISKAASRGRSGASGSGDILRRLISRGLVHLDIASDQPFQLAAPISARVRVEA